MTNIKIREALKKQRVRQWQLAEMLGISEQTLCRRMRKDFSEGEQERIIALIKARKDV